MSDGPEIVDVKEQSRYEIHLDGEIAGIADYEKQPGTITFTRTQTFAGYQGQGLARRMVGRALRDAQAEGLTVIPICFFVAECIKKNREFLDLVPADRRGEFGLPAE